MTRTKFTLYRPGSTTTTTLTPAWLDIYSQPIGTAEVIARGGVSAGVTGRAAFHRAQDVRVGDILFEPSSNRSFSVIQIYLKAAQKYALLTEILPPIPDDYETGVIEKYWTETLAGASLFSILKVTGRLNLAGGPSAAYPSAGSRLTQSINGDFDIWTRLESDAGGGAAIRYPLIGAIDVSGAGAYVGLRNNAAANFVRIDEVSAGSITETLSVAAGGTAGYVRMRRRGITLHSYYSLSATPTTEADWAEIVMPLFPFTSLATLAVGIFGYCNTGTGSALYWEFLRNWQT